MVKKCITSGTKAEKRLILLNWQNSQNNFSAESYCLKVDDVTDAKKISKADSVIFPNLKASRISVSPPG